MALKTLILNNPLLQRAEVLDIIGDFAFEYGLLTGHEDIRLLSDPTADLYVTYPHRSREECFGSCGFIDALCFGKSVDEILGSDCKNPIFMVNPLVLRFFLWFLSAPDFDFLQKDECYDKLTSYVAKRIDSKVFDTEEIRLRYPAIDMLSPPAFSTQFFRDVLDKCKHTKTLHLNGPAFIADRNHVDQHVDQFFSLMNRKLIDGLRTITINNDNFNLKDTDNNSFSLSIQSFTEAEALKMTNLLLCKYNLSERNPHIYMKIIIGLDEDNRDLTTALSIPSHDLHFMGRLSNFLNLLIASSELPHSPILTHLTIDGFYIDESVSSELRKAIQEGKLPNLRRVELIDCCKDSLRNLDWPDEVEISVTNEESKHFCAKCESDSDSESESD